MKNRQGFTLIELLVVISIIALLIAILLPALSGVRASARIAQCLSNISQHGTALNAYAVENKQFLPELEFWYTLSGPQGSTEGVSAGNNAIRQTGLKSQIGQDGVIADRALNEYFGDSPDISRCPEDQGDPFENRIDDCYQDYGTSYQPQWKDGANSGKGNTYFGVISVFGRAALNGNGRRQVVEPSAKLGETVKHPRTNELFANSWSTKILLGDFIWHGNRPITDPDSNWHIGSSIGARKCSMLFGDGHGEFYTFPDANATTNTPVDVAENGFW